MMMACSKNHQSQFLVPEMPGIRVISAKGDESLALLMAVVLPEPLSPMTMYHGST